MFSAKCFIAGVMLVSLHVTGFELTGQSTRAASAPRHVEDAYCDSVGAHVVYDDGRRFVKKARHNERCSDLRISDDKRAVGWLMTSEARAERDGKVVQRWTQSDLFVNGSQVKYDGDALYEWRFHSGGRQVVLEAGLTCLVFFGPAEA